jgi:hypothetical protein
VHIPNGPYSSTTAGKKTAMEAPDEFVWKAENKKDLGAQTDFGLAANGEPAKIDEGQLYCSNGVLLYKPLDARTPSGSNGNWKEWYSGMDGFGGLVMLAAFLIV